MNKPKYVVVQEWINNSELIEIDRSGFLTKNIVQECSDLPNDYYAIMELDADGEYYNELEDFHNKEEAWARYDELTKEETNGR